MAAAHTHVIVEASSGPGAGARALLRGITVTAVGLCFATVLIPLGCVGDELASQLDDLCGRRPSPTMRVPSLRCSTARVAAPALPTHLVK